MAQNRRTLQRVQKAHRQRPTENVTAESPLFHSLTLHILIRLGGLAASLLEVCAKEGGADPQAAARTIPLPDEEGRSSQPPARVPL